PGDRGEAAPPRHADRGIDEIYAVALGDEAAQSSSAIRLADAEAMHTQIFGDGGANVRLVIDRYDMRYSPHTPQHSPGTNLTRNPGPGEANHAASATKPQLQAPAKPGRARKGQRADG